MRGRRKGFTFVEMMVVLALFGILGVSLFSSFSMGLKVWKRSASLNLVPRKALLGLERFSIDMRRAANYSLIGLVGSSKEVMFANIANGDVRNISYVFSPDDGGLLKVQQSARGILDGEDVQQRRLFTGAKNVSFSYFGWDNQTGNYTFTDEWESASAGLPFAVRIAIELDEGVAFEKVVRLASTR